MNVVQMSFPDADALIAGWDSEQNMQPHICISNASIKKILASASGRVVN